MDKKNASLNIIVSLIFNILVIIANFFAKKILINTCGDLANGYYSLLMDIVDIFTLFEAGVGSAILFAMYSPIINKDYEMVYVLYRTFKKIYFIIFLIISAVGLLFTPFIYFFVKDSSYDFNVYIAYLIVLISISTTHLYSYKTSLFNACKKNYIVTIINLSCQIMMRIFQIIILYLTKNFILFLCMRLVNNFTLCIIYTFIEKKFVLKRFINCNKIELSNNEKNSLKKNVSAIAKYKIGGILGNTLDSIIISLCINVLTLGFFSNYRMLVATSYNVLQTIFTSINGVIAHSLINSNKDKQEKNFFILQKINFIIGFVCFICLYSVIDNIVIFWIDKSHIIPNKLTFLLIINYFLQYTLISVRVFKESAGLFYYDRNLSLIEGIINFILSIILVQFLDIEGVMLGTIITNLFFSHIFEPYILFKNHFEKINYNYYFDKILQFILFILSIIIVSIVCNYLVIENNIINAIVR